jgi:glycosyltransferase 2 family protein
VSTRDKPFYKTKWFNFSLGIIITLGCLWWAFQQMLIDDDGTKKSAAEVFAKISAAFCKADYRSLPVMWACLAAFYWLKVIRWKMLLEPLGKFRPMRELFPATIIGFAFNNVLPAHLGEFVRVFVFSRQTGLPRTAVLTSIVLERVFDVIAILTFLALGLFLVDRAELDPIYVQTAWVLAGCVCTGLIGAAVYLIWTKPVLAMADKVLTLLPFVPEGLRGKIMGILETAAGGLESLRSPRLLSGILATSFVQWMLNGLTIHLALWAFGIDVPLAVSAIVLGVTAIGVTVPASPGYFGIIQGCFLLVLNLFGEDREVVFAASIYYHMLQWVPVTMIGMLFFSRAGLKIADIQEEAAE